MNKPKAQTSTTMRINSFLAQAGVASRRGADQMILDAKVKVNGEIVTKPGIQVDPTRDIISVNLPTSSQAEKWENLTQAQDYIIYALYKPKGYVTSLKPQGHYPIVRKLIPASPRVFPVGRLDRESEGLLILTNDGGLAYQLTHPSSHIPKTYIVHCTMPHAMNENTLKSYLGRVAKGVKIQGRKTLPAHIVFKRWLRPRMAELEITLKEGRNRQIRRMLGSLDIRVDRLIRTRIGDLRLENLSLNHGEYVTVTREAIVTTS